MKLIISEWISLLKVDKLVVVCLSFSKKKKKRVQVGSVIVILGIVGLGIILFLVSWKAKFIESRSANQLPEKQENISLPEKNNTCPYLAESNLTTSDPKLNKMVIGDDLAEWRKIPHSYIINLWKKGYHWGDILQLWQWKIPEPDIPDLKAEKRIGVINELCVMFNFDRLDKDIPKEEKKNLDKYVGLTKNMVVIVRKIPDGGPIINIEKGQFNAPMVHKQIGYHTKKIINLFLSQEKINSANYQISVLDSLGVENFGQEAKVAFGRSGGKSAGNALYLALLSAYHQRPISRQVAATGALSLSTKIIKKGKVNNQEFAINPGTILPIEGLKWKTQVATDQGINRFVFSKYQSPPHLLSEWQRRKWKGSWDSNNNKLYTEEKWILAENYQEAVPAETKSKIKEIHWAENIQELKKLILWGKLS